MALRSPGLNGRWDVAFRWVAQLPQTILDPDPMIKHTTPDDGAADYMARVWFKDTGALNPTWKKLLTDTLSAIRNA
jgi:hypothetical protein